MTKARKYHALVEELIKIDNTEVEVEDRRDAILNKIKGNSKLIDPIYEWDPINNCPVHQD